jgi:hypothetical protein
MQRTVSDYLRAAQEQLTDTGGAADLPTLLAQMVGIDPQRMATFLKDQSPMLNKEELKALCSATSTGLDTLFGLPRDLENDNIVEAEFREIYPTGPEPESKLFFAGPGTAPTRIDIMRSLLQLRCLKLCLERFPAGSWQ